MQENKSKTQVVIVGAGPTGLSMAAQLQRFGVDFILLEKNPGITNLSKAIVVQARSMEIFRELGIVEEAVKRGAVTTAMHMYYQGKLMLELDLAGLGRGFSFFPFALSLEQSKTEQLLLEYIEERNAKIEWDATVEDLKQVDNGVTIYYKDGNGNDHRIDADYLVGCDGAGSWVRNHLGLSFEGSTEPKLFYVADVVIDSPVINKNGLYMHLVKKGFVLFFPMEGEGHYRIIGILPDHDQSKKEWHFSDIQESIRTEIVSPVEFKELRWFSSYKVHSRMADHFVVDRCFIAGDAAHIHTPAGGQGMNTGIQDAYNLAWKLAYKLRGEVNQQVLDTYDTERRANARHLLQTTDRMFDIMSGVNSFWNFIRLNFFPLMIRLLTKSEWVRKRMFPMLGQLNIAYPDSFLSASGTSIGKVKAGMRLPYFIIENGKDIHSYLEKPEFKLLFVGDDASSVNAKWNSAKIRLSHGFVHIKQVPEELFGKASNFYIFLRPDNHVSWIGKEFSSCLEHVEGISNLRILSL